MPPDLSALSNGGKQHAQPCWRMIRVAYTPNRLRLSSVLQSFRPQLVVLPPRHGSQHLQIRMVRPCHADCCHLCECFSADGSAAMAPALADARLVLPRRLRAISATGWRTRTGSSCCASLSLRPPQTAALQMVRSILCCHVHARGSAHFAALLLFTATAQGTRRPVVLLTTQIHALL